MDNDNGHILTNDHGEETDFGDLTALLSDNIWIFLEGEIDDEVLNDYLSSLETDAE